jgi:hypothetical protein
MEDVGRYVDCIGTEAPRRALPAYGLLYMKATGRPPKLQVADLLNRNDRSTDRQSRAIPALESSERTRSRGRGALGERVDELGGIERLNGRR